MKKFIAAKYNPLTLQFYHDHMHFGTQDVANLPQSLYDLIVTPVCINSSGDTGEKYNISQTVIPDLPLQKHLLLGVGENRTLSLNRLRKCAGELSRDRLFSNAARILIEIPDFLKEKLSSEDIGQAFCEGLVMGAYRFPKLGSKFKPVKPKTIDFSVKKEQQTAITASIKKSHTKAASTNFARDLMNAPANLLQPSDFVSIAQQLFHQKDNVSLKIIDSTEAQKLGMGAFLSVGKGSVAPSYILVIEYLPSKIEKPIALIGKGITFDAGGISMKDEKGMFEMKADMGGGAAVLSAIKALSELGSQKNVIGLIPLAENLPSGSASKPGDVVQAMDGHTIEIRNTDAEGRLVMADALCYAQKFYQPKVMIDISTLTYATIINLGHAASSVMGHKKDQPYIDRMIEAGQKADEKLDQSVLHKQFRNYLESPVADLINMPEEWEADTGVAAMFLYEFVRESGIPWIHIDMASTMKWPSTKGYKVEGMSGANVRTLINFIEKEE